MARGHGRRLGRIIITNGIACAAFAWTIVAGAQRPAMPVPRSPLMLDVAGVRIGMPIAQVRAALRATYRCEPTNGALTFDQTVADEVRKRRTGSSGRWGGGLGASFEKCRGPGGEQLTVTYAEIPGGAVVDRFKLLLSHDRFVAADVRRSLMSKFGRPTSPTPTGGSWCDAGYRCDTPMFADGPRLSVYEDSSSVVVEADRGQRADAADAAAVLAAADRIAPKRSGAAF